MTGAPAMTGASTGASATTTSSAASVAPSPTALVQAPGASTGTRPAPTATIDPYMDAGALPKATASGEPTGAPGGHHRAERNIVDKAAFERPSRPIAPFGVPRGDDSP